MVNQNFTKLHKAQLLCQWELTRQFAYQEPSDFGNSFIFLFILKSAI